MFKFKKFRDWWKTILCLTLMFVIGSIVYFLTDGDILGTIGFPLLVAFCFADHAIHGPLQT